MATEQSLDCDSVLLVDLFGNSKIVIPAKAEI